MNEFIYCANCGQKLPSESKFCHYCGAKVVRVAEAPQPKTIVQTSKPAQKSLIDSATETLNGWTGEQKRVPIHLKRMFSEVFNSHTEQEAESLFIAGTAQTTPTLTEVSDSPVKPWLFSRVLASFVIAVAILVGSFYLLNGEKMYVGLIAVSALAVPFSLLIMFFEINTFKNISVFKITKIFMVGGVASLLVSLFLYEFVDVSKLTILTAVIIAVVEETGKLIMIAYYINRIDTKFVLNGLLIGAAIGAGFATFETAGYAGDMGLSVLLIRSVGALGTHTMWCAMVGAALGLAKGSARLSSATFEDGRFIRFFVIAIALHALWDAPVGFDYEKMVLLIVIAWVVVLVLINAGLREVRTLKQVSVDQPSHN
ncbi:PrsW family glutamic-type intramembrane protease [Lactiplantibacillus daoliensis]|uniref:PrsW family glutamic-type intramembrane protease n=1 Tax=Lactiplantibacillus daoliensis TaxID=2559916 RepID=A0ABW1UH46_9LACO|nr:PrsW family intramembrane metalloprotease [Lactiplantibacillus daoliensis]